MCISSVLMSCKSGTCATQIEHLQQLLPLPQHWTFSALVNLLLGAEPRCDVSMLIIMLAA